MCGRPGAGKARARGNIETLRSGALRVRMYAGIDPVTKRRHNLIEVVPPGPKAWRDAEKIRDRFLNEVAEKRNPRTSATVDQLLTRYLNQFDGAPNTLANYRGYVRNHVSPFLGHLKVGELEADVLRLALRRAEEVPPSLAPGGAAPSIGAAVRTSATGDGVARMSAVRSVPRRSATSTSCCPGRTAAPCGCLSATSRMVVLPWQRR